ncbi:ubiquitin-conjugating enzyme E2 32-like isoform X2 [Cucurbita pepo subsp. pepo]|uniref:ubiquitin-conjugating enzyme E2 32-like isoform X2 n=1 Tax=Cucurbita pepo subsp. pepo TaxID=3664 RepID=UPI000C9D4861|nr:ubiquitin-conjugating enzyme E2 32-like isoform X2 [Cucurbita pepo subsp. pepo]
MAEDKYNLKNPAVKRILQEVKELQSNPSDDFTSLPLEENIFEWQFAIRGPDDSEFEGGIYHGRIQLPAEYPFKPPSFMLLTPNGRFETQTKICLSISNHHPEHWQPSWSVRTALVALIAFMPTNPNGALGSLDYKKKERRELAIKSREAPPRFGTPERQKLINEPGSSDASEEKPANVQVTSGAAVVEIPNPPAIDMIVEEAVPEGLSVNVNLQPEAARVAREVPSSRPTAKVQQRPETRVHRPADDWLFKWAAIGLTLAIVVLLLKKFMKASAHGSVFMDES